MDRVVIYGLGKYFTEKREQIESNVEVVGYSDKDEERVREFGNKGIIINELHRIEYDYILVTTLKIESKVELAIELGVEENKICFYHANYRVMAEKITYSECGEDLIVDGILSHIVPKYEEIHYLDLGVYNPISGDNTYYFYSKGAKGILVEADGNLSDTIERARGDRDIIINKAIYDKDDEVVSFYRCVEDAGLSSLDSNHVSHWEGQEFNCEKTLTETITVNKALEMLGAHCDLLSIDIEGFDYKALESIDYEKYQPTTIVVEMLEDDWCEFENMKIYELLIGNGYVLYSKTRPNGIFVHKKYLK